MLSKEITNSFDRLERYLGRARAQLEAGERAQALADVAEVSEIARRLWVKILADVHNGKSA